MMLGPRGGRPTRFARGGNSREACPGSARVHAQCPAGIALLMSRASTTCPRPCSTRTLFCIFVRAVGIFRRALQLSQDFRGPELGSRPLLGSWSRVYTTHQSRACWPTLPGFDVEGHGQSYREQGQGGGPPGPLHRRRRHGAGRVPVRFVAAMGGDARLWMPHLRVRGAYNHFPLTLMPMFCF